MKRFFTSILLLCLSHLAVGQCAYKLELTDLGRNGWDSAVVTVQINQISKQYTLDRVNDNGTIKIEQLVVNTGDSIKIRYKPGKFNEEIRFRLLDANLVPVYSSTFNPAGGALFSLRVVCPFCPDPTDIRLESILATSAKIRWTPAQNGSKYRVIYGLKDFALGQGDTLFTTLPKATLPGLTENTAYTFFVSTLCDLTDTSKVEQRTEFKTYLSDDISVTGINIDVANCNLKELRPTFQFKNNGANPQTLFSYSYTVNGKDAGVTAPADGLYTGVVGKDSTITIGFETPYTFEVNNEYEVCVFTQLRDPLMEDDTLNNRFCKRFTNALAAPYREEFETWGGGWVATPSQSGGISSWEHGEPNKANIKRAPERKNAWVTNLDGNYANKERSYLTSPCYNFTSTGTQTPYFYANAFVETQSPEDYIQLEVSTNGGKTWRTVGSQGIGLNWYNTTLPSGLPAWAGNTGGWVPISAPLTGVQGQDSVQLRFVFNSNDSIAAGGFGIDNVRISVPKLRDLAVVGVTTSAENIICGSLTDSVIVTVANLGLASQDNFRIAYFINTNFAFSETLISTIPPNTSKQFTIKSPFNSLGTTTDLVITIFLPGDEDQTNDGLEYSIAHRPWALPFVENFENGNNPGGWALTPGARVTGGHENLSRVLASRLSATEPTFVYESVAYSAVLATDSLTFDYRAVEYLTNNAFSLVTNQVKVEVSTDCGANYVTLGTIDSSNHTATKALTKRGYSLSAYAGQAVRVRITGTRTSGDFYFDIDHLGIRGSSVSTIATPTITSIKVYPNPTSGQVYIKGKAEQPSKMLYELYNVTGQQVLRTEGDASDEFLQEVDLSQLPIGLYFVRISDGVSYETVRVVKN
jgi:Secretion system C-terminal sorting domain